jgi:hypothetical protein
MLQLLATGGDEYIIRRESGHQVYAGERGRLIFWRNQPLFTWAFVEHMTPFQTFRCIIVQADEDELEPPDVTVYRVSRQSKIIII